MPASSRCCTEGLDCPHASASVLRKFYRKPNLRGKRCFPDSYGDRSLPLCQSGSFRVLLVALSPSAPSIPAPRRLVVHMLETPDLKLVLEALNMGAVFQWKGGVFLLKVHVMLQNLGG